MKPTRKDPIMYRLIGTMYMNRAAGGKSLRGDSASPAVTMTKSPPIHANKASVIHILDKVFSAEFFHIVSEFVLPNRKEFSSFASNSSGPCPIRTRVRTLDLVGGQKAIGIKTGGQCVFVAIVYKN